MRAEPQASQLTRFGFVWRLDGQPDVEVERVATSPDKPGKIYRAVRVKCGNRWVDIEVSPQGRSIRAWLTIPSPGPSGIQQAEMEPGEWS